MQTKIRIGAVSYLNTKPLIYGFDDERIRDRMELLIDYPSNIAEMLLDNRIDVGLVPVAVIPAMKEHYIISNYCIGCDGEVASVCLFSEVPLQNIEKILLDYQSRSSVALLKVLVKQYWKLNVVFEETSGDYQSTITGTTAGLVIGDRALKQRSVSPYFYDLGLEWKNFTGLPFVFAAWISNKKLEDNFIDVFNAANSWGLQKMDEVVARNPNEYFDLKHYYTDCISFQLDDKKKQGLKEFLKRLQAHT